jgi:hypothetical protein
VIKADARADNAPLYSAARCMRVRARARTLASLLAGKLKFAVPLAGYCVDTLARIDDPID